MEDIHQTLKELKNEAINLRKMYEKDKEFSYLNILIWGRILINHTENLKGYDREKFEKWYHRYRLEIFGEPEDEAKQRNLPDKVLNFFIKARNELEHQEIPKFSTTMTITNITLPNDLGPRPPNASGIFIDGFGVGWQIKNPDGSLGKLYVRLPEDKVKTLIKPTNMHSFDKNTLNEIFSKPLDKQLKYYVDYLCNMVDDAIKNFS